MNESELSDEVARVALVRDRHSSMSNLVRGWKVDLYSSVSENREFRELLADHMFRAMQAAELHFDAVYPIARSGRPIGLAFEQTCRDRGLRLIDERLVRGELSRFPGVRVLILDDTVNTGLTSRLAARRIRRVGAIPVGVGVVVSVRSSAPLANSAIPLISLLNGRALRRSNS